MLIREANVEDVPIILQYIHELAEYEKSCQYVKVTDENLRDALFGNTPKVYCHVVVEDSMVVGIAIWFLNFSTWLGKHGIYLEDLYITPAYRGRGFGKALLKTLANICINQGYERLQWWVLDWNESAIDFYHEMGAKKMSEWIVMRVDNSNDALSNLANS